MIRRLFLIALAALAGCSDRSDDSPIAASVIGGAPRRADPAAGPLATPDAALLGATAQGLVRFDAAGQIEPGLAIRWDVSDDGLYYTFRIADRQRVRAADAAARLRAITAAGSRNPLGFVLGAIDEIAAVTPQVIEMRLHAPRPNLLPLLAQPEMALLVRGRGAGPMAEVARNGGVIRLIPPRDPDAAPDDPPRGIVLLRGERAASAVARFQSDSAALVLGGRFQDLAIALASKPAPRTLRLDPAKGLFGIGFIRNAGFIGSAEGRRALAMAIDREQLARRFGVTWPAATTLVPGGVPDLGSPARPDWSDTPLDRRRAIARESVAAWTAREGERPRLSIALPPGPGSRLLLAILQFEWRSIGVDLVRATREAEADLRLIDSVAPAEIASWYLRSFTCDRSAVCSETADALLIHARDAPTLLERGLKLAEADARLAEITPFVPLASPLRWSLVAPRLSGFQENARAVHPLDHLIAPRR